MPDFCYSSLVCLLINFTLTITLGIVLFFAQYIFFSRLAIYKSKILVNPIAPLHAQHGLFVSEAPESIPWVQCFVSKGTFFPEPETLPRNS